jgi:hypothetical protein
MDWYQFFKDFAAPIATVIASGAAAFVAYRLPAPVRSEPGAVPF